MVAMPPPARTMADNPIANEQLGLQQTVNISMTDLNNYQESWTFCLPFSITCKYPIPDDVAEEIDGVPFIGPIDLADLTAEKTGNSVTLRWKNFSKNKTDKAEIFVTEMNQFKEGKADKYQKVGEPLLQQENYTFKVENNSAFYKVLVKAPHHYANVWIVDTNN